MLSVSEIPIRDGSRLSADLRVWSDDGVTSEGEDMDEALMLPNFPP